MLKITTETDGASRIFVLEGKLAGAWVAELDRCCCNCPPGAGVVISLKAVSFIDACGQELLAKLHAGGARLEAEGCMTRSIVQRIVAENPAGSAGAGRRG